MRHALNRRGRMFTLITPGLLYPHTKESEESSSVAWICKILEYRESAARNPEYVPIENSRVIYEITIIACEVTEGLVVNFVTCLLTYKLCGTAALNRFPYTLAA